MGVSNPTNFTHKVHVGFDPTSGGFTGLPDEWAKLLNASAITKEDYAKNPQAVIEVLEFYSKEAARAGEMDQYNVYPTAIPSANQLVKRSRSEAHLRHDRIWKPQWGA
jgi:protein-serine/threonine kinase